jgi:hypothetical protein
MTAKKRVFLILGTLALLALALFAIINLLMISGKTLSANAMHAITGLAQTGSYKEGIKLGVLTPETANELARLDQQLGKLTEPRWRVEACHISGNPCLMRLTGLRRGKTHTILLELSGRLCYRVIAAGHTASALESGMTGRLPVAASRFGNPLPSSSSG